MVCKLALLALPAAAAVFDGTTLVQRSVEGQAQGAEGLIKTKPKKAAAQWKKGKQEPAGFQPLEALMAVAGTPPVKKPKICTDTDNEEFNIQLSNFRQQQEAWVKETKQMKEDAAAEQKAKLDRTVAEFKSRMIQFATPLKGAAQEALSIALDAARPAAERAIKVGTKSVLKPKRPYSAEPNVTLQDIMLELSGRLAASKPQVEQLLLSAWGTVDAAVDKAAKDFPQLADALPRRSTGPANVTELQQYLTEKAFPVLLAEAFPQLGKVLPLLMKAPKNPSDLPEYFKSTVVPILPKECQLTKFLTSMALGAGDIGSRVSSFTSECTSVLMPAPESSTADQGPPPPVAPVKTCVTCKEQFKTLMTDMSNPQSCLMHCQPLLFACVGGLSDDCIHKAVPCLRCGKNKLQQLHKCEGTDDATDSTVAKLDELMGVLKTGTVEQAGVDGFLESVSQLLFKGTFLDPAKSSAPAP